MARPFLSRIGAAARHRASTPFPPPIAQPIPTPTPTVTATPANLQATMNSHPGGIVGLAAGTYRITTPLNCSDNLQLVGDAAGGSIITGALLLTGWTLVSGYWQKTGMPAQQAADPAGAGNTDGSYAFTLQAQDLYVNDVFYRRVSSKAAVTAGTWFWDTTAGVGYMLDNPTGQTVEINNASAIFQGGVNVQLFNLTLKHAANYASSTVNPGDQGWCLLNCTVQFNHGAGIGVGVSSVIWNCRANDNGQQGMTAGLATNAQVLWNEVARNNFAGYLFDWEGGGFKLVNSDSVQVRSNNVHDNNGVGIWGDIDNTNWIIDSNLVTNNQGAGIMYEISFGSTTISNNVCSQNGLQGTGWIRGNILIQNSSGVTVTGNTVTVHPTLGNGITMTHEDRGANGSGVSYDTKNNTVSGNTVTYLGAGGGCGYQEYFDTVSGAGWNNQFNGNHYHVPNQSRVLFSYNGTWNYTWTGFRAFGQEASGTIGA